MAIKSLIIFGSKRVEKQLKIVENEYRDEVYKSLQFTLDRIRFDAANKDVIPNVTGVINPFLAAQLQPSTPGKLTSRTGKFIWSLKQLSQPHGGRFLGNKRRIKKTAALKMIVSRQTKKVLEEYTATMKYAWTGHGRLTSTGQLSEPKLRMPKETSQTFFFRYAWDKRGFKGSAKRPVLTPSAKRNLPDMTDLVERKITALLRRLIA